MKSNKDLITRLKEILLKKAEGYFYQEEVCEYLGDGTEKEIKNKKNNVSEQLDFLSLDINLEQSATRTKKAKQDSSLTLVKRKVSSHHVPPDLTAIKMLLDYFTDKQHGEVDITSLSDEELSKFKDEVLEALSNI